MLDQESNLDSKFETKLFIIEDAHGAMHRRPLDFLGWLVEVGITN